MGTQNNLFVTLLSQETTVEEVDNYIVVTSPVIPTYDGVDGRTILHGEVDPTTEGIEGDFYINTLTKEMFGPKTDGAWEFWTLLDGVDSPTKSIWGGLGGINEYSGDTGFARNILLDDIDERYTATEVEVALAEIAGYGRTTETVISSFNLATDTASRATNIESGWTAKNSTHTWEYVSATSIRINANMVGVLQYGDKIRFKQSAGTYKYFIILAVSAYTGGYTTLTLTAGTDYSVANEVLSSAYYSHQENPIGWPTWFNFTPTYTGFSTDPSGGTSKFCIVGHQCTFILNPSSLGASNSTSFTLTLPVVPLVSAGYLCRSVNNGINEETASFVDLISGNIIATAYRTLGSTTDWTASGDKTVCLIATYII